jgi:TonB family protein
MLGVTAGPRADDADAPICPKAMLVDPLEELFGDFEICPFTPVRKGEMQMVCVESASHLIRRIPRSDPSEVLAVSNRVQIAPNVAQGLLCGSVYESPEKRDPHSNKRNSLCGPTPHPLYPPEAKRQAIQGIVHLRAVIGKDGLIKDIRVIDGHPLLTVSAVEAVKEWKYRPYLLNGNAVEVETTIAVNFTLAKNN